MRARIVFIAALVCLCLSFSLGGPASLAQTTPSQGDLDAKIEQLNSLQQRLNALRQQLQRSGKEEQNALKALQQAEDKLEQIQQRISNADKQLKDAEAAMEAAQRDLVAAEAKLKDATSKYEAALRGLEKRLVQMYKMGPATYLELLLSAESFSDLVTRYDIVKRIVAQNARDLEGIKQAKQALEEELASIAQHKAQLELKRREIAALSEGLRKERAESERVKAERAYYLNRVAQEKERWQKELEEEERQSRELERTIRQLQESLMRSGQTPVWTGGFIWPTTGRISSPYGWRVHPIFGDRRFHSGIDIAAPTGTPVKAAAGGRVILAGWVNGYGNTVVIDHGGGLSTLYGHASKLETSAGKMVMQGDIICKVGSTGFATGPHLHFEVRVNGVTEDPMKRLPK